MNQTEDTESQNENICLFPGCDRPAVDSRDRGYGPSYKARYCDLDEHNAGNLHVELNKEDSEDAPA